MLHCPPWVGSKVPLGEEGGGERKVLSGWGHLSFQVLRVPFSINSVVTDEDTNTSPNHHRCRLLNLVLATIWMLLFLLSLEDTTSTMSKNYLMWTRCTKGHFPTRCHPSQMSSGRERSAACSPSRWSNTLHRIMSDFNLVPPEGSKVTSIQYWLSSLILTCVDIARISESFDDITGCRWWNTRFSCILTLRNILKLLDTCFLMKW